MPLNAIPTLKKATHSKMWVALFRVGNRPEGAISGHNEQQRRCVHTFSALWLLLLAPALIQPHVARWWSQRKEWEVYQTPKVDVVKKVTARASHSLTGSHCSEVLFSQPKELRREPQSQSKVSVSGRQALRWSPITHTHSLRYFKLRLEQHDTWKFMNSSYPSNLWYRCDPDALSGDFWAGLYSLLTPCIGSGYSTG